MARNPPGPDLAVPGEAGSAGGEAGAGGALVPVAAATMVALLVYFQQARLLLLKVGEVFGGVFDTSVPAFPLAGMFFVLMFILLRRGELGRLLADRRRDGRVALAGAGMVLLPLPAALFAGSLVGGSYVFAAAALTTSWVGALAAVRPSTFRFLWPYLALYVAAVGSVSLLTALAGDPLAVVVASISSAMTWLFRLPVQWSSVYITFTPAGGGPASLVITQECSGIASMAIFLLLIGLMHLDMKPRGSATLLLAAGGSVLFVFLNALRVFTLIAGGVYYGMDLFWSLHGWVGYAYYIVGYSVVLFLYARATAAVGQADRRAMRSRTA